MLLVRYHSKEDVPGLAPRHGARPQKNTISYPPTTHSPIPPPLSTHVPVEMEAVT